MDREIADRWCERGILILVLGMLVFTPLAFGGRPQLPGGFAVDFLLLDTFQVAQWLTVGVALCWGIRLWLNPRPQLLWPPICWAVLAFGLYAIGRYFTADIEYVARQELIRILVYVFLFFAVLNNLHRQESIQIISLTLLFLATAISFYAIYQFLTHSTRVWHVYTQYKNRASGTYICPNHLGGFLELLLPLGLGYILVSRQKALLKIFVAYITLVMVVAIALTVSRGTWIASGLSLMFFFGALLFHRSYRLPAFLFLIIVLGFAFVLVPKNYSFQARAKKLIVEGKLDDDLRFLMWEPAYKVWQENPWWGAGPAHFDFRFRKYRPEAVQLQPDRAHNDFLNALADWGLVGAAIISAAWALLLAGVIKTWKFVASAGDDIGGRKASNKFAFVIGASTGLLAILAHSAVDFNMHIPANAMIVVAFMALLSAHLRFATGKFWLTAVPWTKAVVSVVLMAGAVYLAYEGQRYARENYWLARATLAPDYSPAQVALLQKAYTVEPKNFDTAYKIGNGIRVQSHEGGENYKELAAAAMQWFERGMKLNRWDGYNFLYYGWCLDWMGRQAESGSYFSIAEALDPNGYFTMASIGLHYVELNDFAAAKPWFQRSLRLEWVDNPIALNYLNIVNRKLEEDATNQIPVKIGFSSP